MNYLKKQLTKAVKDRVRRNGAAAAAAGVTLALALAAESEDEKNDPVYARYEIDGAGKAADNVRLVFLTDLHEKEFGEDSSVLLDMIDRADPDAVLIGGDMPVTGSHGDFGSGVAKTKVSLALCGELAKKYPVFYGNGNHEQRLRDREYIDRIEDMGITYLSNRTVGWKYNIDITGINLSRAQYRPVFPGAPDISSIRRRVGELDGSRFNILLAHSPLFLEAYAETGADLVLSGHFHGGTIRLPGDVGLMTPQYRFFSRDVVGIRHLGSTDMIISSGLGTHSVNIRINDKPQVVVVDIKK